MLESLFEIRNLLATFVALLLVVIAQVLNRRFINIPALYSDMFIAGALSTAAFGVVAVAHWEMGKWRWLGVLISAMAFALFIGYRCFLRSDLFPGLNRNEWQWFLPLFDGLLHGAPAWTLKALLCDPRIAGNTTIHAGPQLHQASSRVAFISYSSLDIRDVLSLLADMRQERILYWFDQDEIRPGDSITQALNDGLNHSDTLVACISQNQLKSGWSRTEYASALTSFHSDGSKRVVPLILDRTRNDEVPPILRDLRAVRRDDSVSYQRFLQGLAEHQQGRP
jgi:hypothetical protein